jgi:hypothetical protein
MLDFFRKVSAEITVQSQDTEDTEARESPSSPTSVLHDRAGIIVLREDLDFYVIPPTRDVSAQEMIDIKRAAGKVLLKQDGIFSGLRRTDDTGTTEQHLIEMLTAGCVAEPLDLYQSPLTLIGVSTRTTFGDTAPVNRRKQ